MSRGVGGKDAGCSIGARNYKLVVGEGPDCIWSQIRYQVDEGRGLSPISPLRLGPPSQGSQVSVIAALLPWSRGWEGGGVEGLTPLLPDSFLSPHDPHLGPVCE